MGSGLEELMLLEWMQKQGKGGGVSAYPEIATDFHLWLAPKIKLLVVRKESDYFFEWK